MTSKKECYLCTKLHSEQFLKDTDTLYTCDKHTYITMKQVCNLFQIKKKINIILTKKENKMTCTYHEDNKQNMYEKNLEEVSKRIKDTP